MDRSIVKNNYRFLLNLKREPVKVIHNPVCIDGFLCRKAFILISSGNHTKDIKSCGFLGWNIDILIFELPSVRYITIGTYMTFISIIKFYFTFGIKAFKFLQLLFLVWVELRWGGTPWAFPYSLISCTNAPKKRLKVMSLAFLPEAFSQASRAFDTLWRSSSIALRTNSSSEQSIIGLRPWPGRVSKPLIPFSL